MLSVRLRQSGIHPIVRPRFRLLTLLTYMTLNIQIPDQSSQNRTRTRNGEMGYETNVDFKFVVVSGWQHDDMNGRVIGSGLRGLNIEIDVYAFVCVSIRM